MSANDRLAVIASITLRPPPTRSIAAWADERRVLGSRESSRPGRWQTDFTPYLREILDALSPSSPIERVVLQKSAQIGGTEAINCFVGFAAEESPGPILVVQPTDEAVRRWSGQRLEPLLVSTPGLAARFAKPGQAGSGAQLRTFRGGVLVVASATAPSQLRQLPIRWLLLDDVDAYPPEAGNEGDPVDLAERRTETFRGLRKILLVSTPTERDTSRIEAAYLASDRRVYEVPCPECGTFQRLRWARVRWSDLVEPVEPRRARYVCEACEVAIPHARKPWMLARGRWRPTATSPDGTVGFHLSALYSPWTSWGAIAEEFLRAKRDPARLRVWVNTALGETWDPTDGERIGEERRTGFLARREVWGERVPAGVAVLTAGVDVQGDRLEVEIVGWGRGEESWSLLHVVLPGDPSAPADRGVWVDLDALLDQRWDHAGPRGSIRVEGVAVDSGGHHTIAVYRYSAKHRGRRIWAVKGRGGEGLTIWPKRPSRNNKGRVNLYTLGVDAAKETVYARLRVEAPGPGYCHFPEGRDPDWFTQLTCEVRRTRYHLGRPVRYWWKPDGARNEALDLRVYALAALHGWYALGRSIERALDSPASAPEDPWAGDEPAAPPARPPAGDRWLDPRFDMPTGGWL